MTNEEKSNEIAQQSDFTTNARDIDIAFKAAMKMAEWKDSQIPDYGVIINFDIYKSVIVDSISDCDNCDLNSYCKRINEFKYKMELPCKLFDNNRIFKKIKR